jgi:zinc transport system substrate-binding protein
MKLGSTWALGQRMLAVAALMAVVLPGSPMQLPGRAATVAAPSQVAEGDRSATRFAVVVPVTPYAFIVDRVSGGRVTALTLVPPGQSPHSYSPGPQQVASMSGARVLFLADLPFETVVAQRLASSNPAMVVVNVTPGLAPEAGDTEDGHEDGLDPHTWLAPDNIAAQAGVISRSLSDVDPDGAEVYATGLDSLLSDLAGLESELGARLAPYAGSRFYVVHPAFGHFAAAFGLEQVAVEAGGKEPGAKRLAALIDQARADGSRVVIVQPQFSDSAARTLAREIGAQVVTIDPLAYDVFETLRALADAIAPHRETDQP